MRGNLSPGISWISGMSRSAALVVAFLGCSLMIPAIMLALCHEHYRSWQDVCRECETFLLKLYKCELHSRCTVWHWRRYVMEKFNLPSDQAHTYVLTRRHCISINEGFRNQIRYLGTWRHRLHLKKTHRLEVAKSLHTVRAHTHTRV